MGTQRELAIDDARRNDLAAISRQQGDHDVDIDVVIEELDGRVSHRDLGTAWMERVNLRGVAAIDGAWAVIVVRHQIKTIEPVH